MTSTSPTPSDEWIEWNGGECPKGLTVDVELRDGTVMNRQASESFCGTMLGEPCTPDNCNWQHDGGRIDIIAYRKANP